MYRYAEPVRLPKGTTVSLRYIYDNSDQNPMNPNHPPARVRGGNRSSDEMCHLWLQVLPVNFDAAKGDPRMVLQEALARHNTQKNPGDFESHYNLGSMLQAKDDLEGAIREYQEAVTVRPEDATGNNALGAAWVAQGSPGRGIEFLRKAIGMRSEYFDAHYNLALALAAQDDFDEAAKEFEVALRLKPDDAGVEANLGAALAQMGRYDESKSHLQRALEIDPGQSVARENLETVKRAMSGH